MSYVRKLALKATVLVGWLTFEFWTDADDIYQFSDDYCPFRPESIVVYNTWRLTSEAEATVLLNKFRAAGVPWSPLRACGSKFCAGIYSTEPTKRNGNECVNNSHPGRVSCISRWPVEVWQIFASRSAPPTAPTSPSMASPRMVKVLLFSV